MEEGPVISEELMIEFCKATAKQKQKIAEILIRNYANLVNYMVEEAEYASTTAYWSSIQPLSGKMISPAAFIKKYGKIKKKHKSIPGILK